MGLHTISRQLGEAPGRSVIYAGDGRMLGRNWALPISTPARRWAIGIEIDSVVTIPIRMIRRRHGGSCLTVRTEQRSGRAIGSASINERPSMIRKLRSGHYRLYSRKVDPKTGKRRNLGTFKSRAAAENTSARCNISSGISESRRPAWLEPPAISRYTQSNLLDGRSCKLCLK